MKIAVGTVQFGLPYGIANRVGKTPREMAAAILDRAKAEGATLLDTAIAYGDSEQVLGEIGAARNGWQIISKLPGLPPDLAVDDIAQWVETTVQASLDRLRADNLSGLLLHRPHDLLGAHGQILADTLLGLREKGIASAIGVSIYGPEDLDALFLDRAGSTIIPLDIVQAPANALDRRLEVSGWATRLSQAGTRIHLRSAFLQGLLLMPLADLPEHLSWLRPDLQSWHDWLMSTGANPLAATLHHVLSRDYAECVVLGMDSLNHLEQILAAAQMPTPAPPADLHSRNATLLDPRKWTKP